VVPKAPSLDVGGLGRFGDQTTTFTVTSAGGTFVLNGVMVVNFPANSVCDPAKSSYGDGTWDKPCQVLQDDASVTFTATTRVTSSGVAVDVSPAVRFSPSAVVTVGTTLFGPVLTSNKNYYASNPSALSNLAFGYSSSLGGTYVHDYTSDISLITHVNLTTGVIWRRVKHFSGYMIATGEPCEPSPDNPDCIEVDSDGGH
jgi:hypothetical protein